MPGAQSLGEEGKDREGQVGAPPVGEKAVKEEESGVGTSEGAMSWGPPPRLLMTRGSQMPVMPAGDGPRRGHGKGAGVQGCRGICEKREEQGR